MHKFEISTLLELIQRHRVSVAAVVPPLVLTLAKNPAVADYDLSSLRIVLSGAAPLGKELEEALHKRVHKAVFGQVTKVVSHELLVWWEGTMMPVTMSNLGFQWLSQPQCCHGVLSNLAG